MLKKFTKHPKSVGETYLEHGFFAVRFGFGCARAAAKAMTHALFPFVYERGASDEVKMLYNHLFGRVKGSCIYEVQVEVALDIASAYLQWIPGHAQDLVDTGFFQRAEYYVDESRKDVLMITMFYFAESVEKIDMYLKEHAPRLRKEAHDLFGEKFKATRRILKPVAE